MEDFQLTTEQIASLKTLHRTLRDRKVVGGEISPSLSRPRLMVNVSQHIMETTPGSSGRRH